VARAAVAVNSDEPLNVVLNLPPQISLDNVLGGKNGVESRDLIFRQLASAHVFVESKFLDDLVRKLAADSENVRQAHFEPLIVWNIDSDHSRHSFFKSLQLK
jgi:hypothetical protein